MTLTLRNIKNTSDGDLIDTGYINRPNVSKKREMNGRQSPAMLGLNLSLFLPSTSLATTSISEDIKSKSQAPARVCGFFSLQDQSIS